MEEWLETGGEERKERDKISAGLTDCCQASKSANTCEQESCGKPIGKVNNHPVGEKTKGLSTDCLAGFWRKDSIIEQIASVLSLLASSTIIYVSYKWFPYDV